MDIKTLWAWLKLILLHVTHPPTLQGCLVVNWPLESQMSIAMHTLWGWLDEQTDHNLRGPSVLVLSVSVCVYVCVGRGGGGGSGVNDIQLLYMLRRICKHTIV